MVAADINKLHHYTRSGSTWTKTFSTNVTGNGSSEYYTLVLTNNDTKLAYCDRWDTLTTDYIYGSITIFSKSENSWVQESKINRQKNKSLATSNSSSLSSFSISEDGNTVIAYVSTPNATQAQREQIKEIVMFTRNNNTWVEAEALYMSSAPGNNYSGDNGYYGLSTSSDFSRFVISKGTVYNSDNLRSVVIYSNT